ncbi:hypothetical protein BKA64DRAFT_275413 [Cadophora sp. MPI-SDFR-AT-0126]|nr:hypothetical protein BKA64DRAFT_275413 [Leotiomycetes sp. MPI-SDFR-AT-0126]
MSVLFAWHHCSAKTLPLSPATAVPLGCVVAGLTGVFRSLINIALKCDEAKPSCQYCTSRSVQCTYSAPKPSTPTFTTTTPDESDKGAPSSELSTPASTSAPHSTIHIYPTVGDSQWNLCDLELLHFYTASTSLTFSNVPERRLVWQFVLPQIAFSYNFLLLELLALAALHLSHVAPERSESLRAAASTYHGKALPMFRAAIESINSLNCHACSAFGIIVTVYEWASSEQIDTLFFADTESPSAASTIEWAQLLRGSSKIITHFYEETTAGPLGPLLRWDNATEHEALANPTTKFSALDELCNSTSLSVSAAEADALKEALQWLKTIYSMMIITPPEMKDPASFALSWPSRVPDYYLLMVNQRQPTALVLLAHFCLLLNQIEDSWWISGKSRKLLQEVHRTLGPEWESSISWPLQDLVLCEFRNK